MKLWHPGQRVTLVGPNKTYRATLVREVKTEGWEGYWIVDDGRGNPRTIHQSKFMQLPTKGTTSA